MNARMFPDPFASKERTRRPTLAAVENTSFQLAAPKAAT
jgi:hypothetical protein